MGESHLLLRVDGLTILDHSFTLFLTFDFFLLDYLHNFLNDSLLFLLLFFLLFFVFVTFISSSRTSSSIITLSKVTVDVVL